MKTLRMYVRVPLGGHCEDCDLRGHLTITGRPKRHPQYGTKLTTGCEGCGGTGTNTRTSSLEANQVYRMLTPKQRFVMERRLGHHDGKRYTQREIAAVMGVAQQSIAELEANARARIRRLVNPVKKPVSV